MSRIAPIIALALCVVLSGCLTPGAPPTDSALMRGLRFAPIVPDETDHASAELAMAALVSDRLEARRALARLRAVDTNRAVENEDGSGITALGIDMWNSMIDDERDWLVATDDLLDRKGIDEGLRSRLVHDSEDDLLALADDRVWDARLTSAAKLFNAIAEPAGRSLITSSFAPIHFGSAALRYLIDWARSEPISVQRRQALAHWKEFLEREPDAPESIEIEQRVEKAQVRWDRTRRNREVKRARHALDRGHHREALLAAHLALEFAPEDSTAIELRRSAAERLMFERKALRMSERFDARGELLPPGTRELTLALLDPAGDPLAVVPSLEDGPLTDEARYVEASALGETGHETDMWAELAAIAKCKDPACTMSRHAARELGDPHRNSYEVFKRARNRDRWGMARWVLLGPFAGRPFDTDIASLGELLLTLPAIAQTAFVLPFRVIQLPWTPPPETSRVTAVQARRYLAHRPYGDRADEVRDWLGDYERKRGNWVAALSVAEGALDADAAEIEGLREKAARQAFDVASHEERRDMRNAMLHNVAREFRDTRAGLEAGHVARAEVERMTPHRIRISRGFLEENPDVAGPEGLGIAPLLLDDDASNGELHPDGVTLLGGREIEVSFIDSSGDEDAPATHQRESLTDERLARLVSMLEEESFRNSLLDPDDEIQPDAQRDHVFERVRLGLADDVDRRPSAEATFAYRGVRERFGLVRSRESILPFDLVVQGSLSDLSLGAFPRMRKPRQTPDAFLYE